jgi:hypothetical protein
MIEVQKVIERNYSSAFCWSANICSFAVLAQTCMGVFFIPSVSDTIFAKLSFPKPPVNRRGPQFDKHWHEPFRTADKGQLSSLGFVRGATNFPAY